MLGDIDAKNFFKKSKTLCTVFVAMPYNILCGKKLKIARFTARSIWAGMPPMYILFDVLFISTFNIYWIRFFFK